MKHTTNTQRDYRTTNKPRTKDIILHRVKEVCKDHGGCVDIGEGFVAVNTKYYKVTPRGAS